LLVIADDFGQIMNTMLKTNPILYRFFMLCCISASFRVRFKYTWKLNLLVTIYVYMLYHLH